MKKEMILDKILEKADSLYWQGLPLTMTDEEFDSMSDQIGHISKPPETLKGWAQYPDYCLACPNYGLKKVSYEIAKKAVRYWPKWDGIYLQIFEDENGLHIVTRGDGRIGKDLKPFFDSKGVIIPDHSGEFELIYGTFAWSLDDCKIRAKLVSDLIRNDLNRSACYFIPHSDCVFEGIPPKEIPESFGGFAIDGWVIELANGEKFKYKG